MANTTTQTMTVTELDSLDRRGSKVSEPITAGTAAATTTTTTIAVAVAAAAAAAAVDPDSASWRIASPDLHVSETELLSKGRAVIVIVQLAGTNFITSFSNGLLIVGLPTIAAAIQLEPSLMLWPSAAYALTTGSCLLLSGSLSDVLGPRSINLVGCFFIAVFILASGFARTGIELIVCRVMQGIASALVLPSSISIVSRSVERGQRRNVGFATLGLAMPLGFSFGAVLGGFAITCLGWQAGYYIGGGIGFLLFIIGIWALPKGIKSNSGVSVLKRLANEVDWVGAVLGSASIAIFSYILAMLTADIENIKQPADIILLISSIALALAFVFWMHRQEKASKPALIPNSLWKKRSFTSVCLMVLLSNAVCNCMELFSSLYFQKVQRTSPLGASLRLLPSMLFGIALNFLTGWFVNKLSPLYAVLISSSLSAVSPVLMAIANPSWPYWYDEFFAQLLFPISADVLFTIGILIVSDVFPTRTQALAGAVFNTLAQLGPSIGFAITSVISASVIKDDNAKHRSSPEALIDGYKASFWTMFAWMAAACAIGAFGLRNVGRVGEKRD